MTEALFTVAAPVMDEFDSTRCAVRSVTYPTVREVLRTEHYIGVPGSTVRAYGVFVDEHLAGVVTFGTIPSNNAAAVCGPGYTASVLELTRLALYLWAPRNTETWFIRRAVDLLTASLPAVQILVSYADASVGHVGTVYQASNWLYTGMTTGDVHYQLADGTTLHPRTTGFDATPAGGKFVPSPAKHRYVLFVGKPAQRRKLRRELRWPVLDYPKQSDLALRAVS